ncbi:autotransporter-associated beta strand repeat-containing protein [Pontiella sp.]|uniref:autotransporter-associated beta strand repeat-containing protein n=1 Tax=Pontiella sp. TaxID=2837462 RepID=UPI00356A0707
MKTRGYKLLINGCSLLLCAAVQAETWDGGGADNEFSTALNWNNDAIPTNNTGDINGAYTVERSVDITVDRTFVRGGATLNVTGGTHSDSQVGNTVRNYVGNDSIGTLNHFGGSWEIGHIVLVGSGSGSGNGTYNLAGGNLTIGRGGNSLMGVPGGSSLEIGVGSATGLFEMTGGAFASRIGVGIGNGGTFSVLGSGPSRIGIGSIGTGDGDWNQAAGATLRVGIDAGGVAKILIDDDEGDGGAYATFEAGSLLDVGFYNGMTNGGTWTVMEVEGTNIVDNGLAFASGVDTNVWSFNIDNSGTNGLLTVSAVGPAITEYDLNSIADLRLYAASNNVDVAMAPGTYWMAGEAEPHFIEFSGSNNIFDLSGVHIKVDTAELAGYGGSTDVRMLNIGGTNIVIEGLVLSMEKLAYNGTDSYGYPKEFCADSRSQVVRITGSYLTMKNCEFTSGGSYPYGFGDAFGKGSRPNTDGVTDSAWIAHRKQSGILFTGGAAFCNFENVTLNMRSFGHGIFFQQGAHDLYFENCRVLGDAMADSDDIIAHPEYQEWGHATYKEPIPADIRISKHEGGFRSYGNSDYETNGYNQWIENITITNCRVERMRNAVAMGAHEGYLNVYDTEAYECEMGFGSSAYGTTLYKGCKGDALNGPLIYFQYGVEVPATYEVELTGDEPGHGVWPIALISGADNRITLTSSATPGVYSDAAYVNTSQNWREWRHRPSADIDELSTGNYGAATTGNFITNRTGQILVFGSNAVDNVDGVSTGGVINKGSGNEYAGETLVPGAILVEDTWTYPPNSTNVSWAQWDTDGNLILPTPPYTVFGGTIAVDDAQSLGGSPDGDGGTTVSNGTLEVASGFALQGEALVLSGSGTAGQGALYSDGAVANSTRLSSSSGSIALAGDTSIGVGVAGNQLLIGKITGTGSLTKTGPGTLVMEGVGNTYGGATYISNGWIRVRANKVRHDLVIAAGAGLVQNGNAGLNQAADDTTLLDGTIDINGRSESDTGAYSIHIGSLGGGTTGLITATSTAATQTVNIASTTEDSSFDGTIGGTLQLNKNGAGTTLALNGICSHSAGTVVNAGRLGGTGTITGDVTVNDTAGFEVNFSRALKIGGTLAFVGDSFEILFPVGAPGFDSAVSNAWKIAEAGSISGFAAESFSVDASAYDPDGGSFFVSESGGDLFLNFEPKPYTALEEWRFEKFGTYANAGDAANTANPDGDARDNLLEYGTGSDPNVFDSNSVASVGTTAEGSRLTITFDRIADPALTYWVEAKTNLVVGSWDQIWSSNGASNTTGSVTVEDAEPILNHWSRYLRMKLMH